MNLLPISHRITGKHLAAVFWLVLIVSGCDRTSKPEPQVTNASPPPPQNDLVPKEVLAEQQAEPTKPVVHKFPAGDKPWLTEDKLPLESWMAHYIGSNCIGYTHFRIGPTSTLAAGALSIVKTDIVEIAVDGKPVRRKTVFESFAEQTDGKITRFTETTLAGNIKIVKEGTVSNNTLQLSSTNAAGTTQSSTPFPSTTWGPIGIIAILQQKSMTPDEERSAEMYVPQLEQMARIHIKALKPELTTLTNSVVKELIPIEVTVETEGHGGKSKNWINDRGQIEKTLSANGLLSFRTTQSEAEYYDAQLQFAQAMHTTVVCRDLIALPLNSSEVTFNIHAEGTDPYPLFQKSIQQSVRSLSARTAEIKIVGMEQAETTSDAPPQDEHRKSTALIDSDSATVKELGKQLVADTQNASEIAHKIQLGLQQQLKFTPLNREFSVASKTAQKLSGDHVDVSILTAALLRSQGIASKIIAGLMLRQSDSKSEFVFHTWCEAWINQRWVPIDATQANVSADHLKMLESAFSEANPYTVLLPALEAIPKIEIEQN